MEPAGIFSDITYAPEFIPALVSRSETAGIEDVTNKIFALSSNGRTQDSGSCYHGSSPCGAVNLTLRRTTESV